MKQIKKTVSVIVAVAMMLAVTTLFSACVDVENPTEKPGSTASSAATIGNSSVAPGTAGREPEPTTTPGTTNAPEPVPDYIGVDTAYTFGMVQQNKNDQLCYLNGKMNGFYLDSTVIVAEALSVYLEKSGSGYYLYCYLNGQKTYINMVISNGHVNGAYETTPATVYTYDATLEILVSTINGDIYTFGTRNDRSYTTIGPVVTKDNGFWCKLAPVAVDDESRPSVSACGGHSSDPYENVDPVAFYASYTTACCYQDAQYRSEHNLMSGTLEIPGQYATAADHQPMEGDRYIRNTDSLYVDNGNTYVVVDSQGQEQLRVHKGGAYITLEEVAAYMYAFGNESIPANYSSNKNTSPSESPWGSYLRVNYTYFSGDTERYPYEPTLPNISGCGGELNYYEMDIGTTGTTTPGYDPDLYNDGNRIVRGAARIVCVRQDLNGDGQYGQDEVYVFYTANHYNDFQEYLNYYGGWGKIFGNMTGNGVFSSKYEYNPTPYVKTAYASFKELFGA